MPPTRRLTLTLAASLGLAWGCVPEDGGGDDEGPIVLGDAEMTDGAIDVPDEGVAPDDGVEADEGVEVDGGVEPDMALPETTGLEVLGNGQHTTDAVTIDVIATADEGLNIPRDLDFNPWADSPELWVVNRADDSTTTIWDPGTPDQYSVHLIDPYALHFMEEVSSIDFGQPGMFGTCQESRNTYNGQGAPNDFMGPSLWPSDMDVYARTNPDAVAFVGFDLGSHLDMQHESPLCMGIVWERDNVYWVFEGLTSSIARNDFGLDHGPGYDDHSDGVVARFGINDVRRVADVPSHLVFDHDTRFLYIADTGNARVAMLDANSAEMGRRLPVVEPGTELMLADHDPITSVFEHDELTRPSGLAQDGDVLFVGDNATGRIWAIGLDGEVIDYLDTGLPDGALMGIEVGPDGNLWVVDAVENRVLRISPLAE